jgi:hypothetical protein
VRDHRRQVQLELDRVRSVLVGREALVPPALDVGARVRAQRSWATPAGTDAAREVIGAFEQVIAQDLVEREHARQRAPLRRHVGDGHALVHRHRGEPIAVELDGVVEDFILIEQPAQRDDHVLADDAGL